MLEEIGPYFAVGLDQLAHRFRMHGGPLPGGCGCDQSFNVEPVGIEEEANEGHLIVGFVADIADYENAWMAGEAVNLR